MASVIFVCPYCDAQDEVSDIHATSIYRCGSCGLPVPTDTIDQYLTPAAEINVLSVDEPSMEAGSVPPIDLAIPSTSARSIDSLREKIQLLTRQHDGAGERLGLMLQEYQQLKQQLDRVTAQLQQQRDDDVREHEQMQGLEQELDHLTSQVERQVQEDRDQRERIQVLEQECANFERARDEAGERHEQELAEIRERMQAALRQRDELRIDLEGLQRQRDQWLNEIETKGRMIDDLENRTESLQAELRAAAEVRNNALANLEQQAADLVAERETVCELRETIENHASRTAGAEQERDALAGQLTTARSALKDAETVIASLQPLQDELGLLARSSLETRQENQRIREENAALRHDLLDELQRIRGAFYTGSPPPRQQLVDLEKRIANALGDEGEP